ncbi:MAG: ADP-ribosylglycohydrolase family protein, partial [Bacteroidota bacterium]
IRSEIWGMLFPGDPATAARFAKMDSELDHTGFSVEAEQYFSACAALAFVTDDPEEVLRRGLEYVSATGLCARLAHRVQAWYADYGFAVTAGKIKSHYGDADFTSAPMNVGFTLLAIRHAGRDFDRVIKALHLGHDSDCVVATAGAILGIIAGYDGIPVGWKRRVGNELLISPEVSGIDCPDTLTDLATKTCAVGSALAADVAPPRPFAFRAEVEQWPSAGQKARVCLYVENLGKEVLRARCTVGTDQFMGEEWAFALATDATYDFLAELSLPDPMALPADHPHWTYRVRLRVNGETYDFTKGIPYYGQWLLLGPFIRDDARLAPLDPDYPDHGLASMPSVSYMNHDAVNRDHDFLDHAAIEALLNGEERDKQPYGVRTISPTAMSVDLGKYFYGKGERTLYLTTRLHCAAATRQWLCLGAANHLTAWLNGERVLRTDRIRRRWPATAVAELLLREGENTLTLRMDTVTDDFRLDVGLKDHAGKHHHQSHWNTSLVFTVPKSPRIEDLAWRDQAVSHAEP